MSSRNPIVPNHECNPASNEIWCVRSNQNVGTLHGRFLKMIKARVESGPKKQSEDGTAGENQSDSICKAVSSGGATEFNSALP